MKNKIPFTILLLFVSQSILSQNLNNYKDESSNKIVDIDVFNSLIISDLNFLILGDNSPQQGVEFTLDEDKSKIKLGGYLNSKSEGILMTLDGEFTVDEGAYFFDENGGSKKSKITINYYIPFKGKRWYEGLNNKNGKTQRAFIKKAIYKKDSLNAIYKKFAELHQLMKFYKLPIDSLKDEDKSIKSKIEEENIVTDLDKRKQKYLLKTPVADKPLKIVKSEDDESEGESPKPFTLKGTINNLKLIEDYEKIIVQIDSIGEVSRNKQLEIAKNVWTAKRIWFIGLSPFYQRENINIYNVNTSSNSFDDYFNDIKGDLYGFSSSLNLFYQSKNKLKRTFFSKYFLARGLVDFSRNSNIDSFKKKTFGLSEPTGELINNESINNITTKEGYTGDNEYTYGFRQSYGLELYGSFIKQFGLFGNIGYNKITYNSNGLGYQEKFPIRLGALFNLKSKVSQKNLLTIQLFMDRTDLNLHPNGEKGDLKFGFKLGLPFNVSKNL